MLEMIGPLIIAGLAIGVFFAAIIIEFEILFLLTAVIVTSIAYLFIVFLEFMKYMYNKIFPNQLNQRGNDE